MHAARDGCGGAGLDPFFGGPTAADPFGMLGGFPGFGQSMFASPFASAGYAYHERATTTLCIC